MDDYKARVRYDDIEWLVIDAFKENGERYLYIIEDLEDNSESYREIQKYDGKVKCIFIKELPNKNYIEVEDKKELEELNKIVLERALRGE